MRGISPVIATVIILAVTIAIAIAVVGWVMGLFRSSTKASVQLQIMPDSYINVSGSTLCLHVMNKGSTTAEITKVEISGVGSFTGDYKLPAGTSAWLAVGNATACTSAGTTVNSFSTSSVTNVTPGVTYSINVYTADGSVFPGQATAS